MKFFMCFILLLSSCGLNSSRNLRVSGHKKINSSSDAEKATEETKDSSEDLKEPVTSPGGDVDVPRGETGEGPDEVPGEIPDKLPGEFPDPEEPEGEKLTSFTYPVNSYNEHTQQFHLTADRYENKIPLVFDKKTVSETIQQAMLENRYESFYQGSETSDVEQVFTVNSQGIVDILIVIDNSLSMMDVRDKVSKLLPQLTSYLNHLEWRIAIATTDTEDAPILSYIDSKDRDPYGSFERIVKSITNAGSLDERGIYQARRALQYGDWLRSASDLAILFVSDEDNCSTGKDCESEPTSFLKYLNTIKTRNELAIYGLIRKPSDSAADCGSISHIGYQYQALVDVTNGLSESICNDNFSSVFSTISENINEKISRRFQLNHSPLSLDVYRNGEPLNNSLYSLSEKTISIHTSLDDGDEIKVVYTTSVESKRTVFTLRDEVSKGSQTSIAINSSPVDPSPLYT